MNPRVPEPRHLTAEQRRSAEQDFDKINRMGQSYGIGESADKSNLSIYNKKGLFSTDNTSMPKIQQS